MGNHNNRGDNRGDGKFNGRRDFGGRSNDRGGRGGFGGDRERPQMHGAVCDDCGKNCEVPFRPTGDKPIFCSDCFRNKRDDNGGDNRRDSRGGDRGGFKERRPRQDFGDKKSFKSEGGSTQDYKMQFDILNKKLDKILKALAPIEVSEEEATRSTKKNVDTKALKKQLSDVLKPKTDAKKATKKKVVKTVKAAVKKVVKKVTAKKAVVKKAIKKVVKKTPAKKVVKKVASKKKK